MSGFRWAGSANSFSPLSRSMKVKPARFEPASTSESLKVSLQQTLRDLFE